MIKDFFTKIYFLALTEFNSFQKIKYFCITTKIENKFICNLLLQNYKNYTWNSIYINCVFPAEKGGKENGYLQNKLN